MKHYESAELYQILLISSPLLKTFWVIYWGYYGL